MATLVPGVTEVTSRGGSALATVATEGLSRGLEA